MKFETTQIRAAVYTDLRVIVALERSVDTAPHWPLTIYQAMVEALTEQPRCLFVAEREGVIVGFAAATVPLAALWDKATLAEIESVVVAEGVRREGVGRALCLAVLRWCRSQNAEALTLEVRRSSVGAIALYTALGFISFGVRLRYYNNPLDDALIMRRSVK